jgi:hypothetical protein
LEGNSRTDRPSPLGTSYSARNTTAARPTNGDGTRSNRSTYTKGKAIAVRQEMVDKRPLKSKENVYSLPKPGKNSLKTRGKSKRT